MTPSTTSWPGWVRSLPITGISPDVSGDLPPDAEAPAVGDHDVACRQLQSRLGHVFSDPQLLTRALTHRSWCAENRGEPSNERLEFLGDSILGLVVTDHLYRSNPDLPEGHLAKARAAVVSSTALAEVAAELLLGDALRLGRGEELSSGRSKSSILADAMEAVFGAVWIDAGMDSARPLILGLLADRIDSAVAGPGSGDFKTRLQEMSANLGDSPPVYEIAESGPDHAKEFTATVMIAGERWGTGSGRSKKEAEQAAAAEACDRIGATDGPRELEGEQRTDA